MLEIETRSRMPDSGLLLSSSVDSRTNAVPYSAGLQVVVLRPRATDVFACSACWSASLVVCLCPDFQSKVTLLQMICMWGTYSGKDVRFPRVAEGVDAVDVILLYHSDRLIAMDL